MKVTDLVGWRKRVSMPCGGNISAGGGHAAAAQDTLNTVEAMTTWKGDDEVSRHEPPPDRKPQHEGQSGRGLIEMMRNIEDGRGAMGCADLAEPCALSAGSYHQ